MAKTFGFGSDFWGSWTGGIAHQPVEAFRDVRGNVREATKALYFGLRRFEALKELELDMIESEVADC